MGRSYCSEVYKQRVLEEKTTLPSDNRSQPFKEDVVLTLGDALRLYYLLRAELILTFAMFWKEKDILYLPMAFQNYRDEISGRLSLVYLVS